MSNSIIDNIKNINLTDDVIKQRITAGKATIDDISILDAAIKFRDKNFLEFLFDNKANINAVDHRANTLLHLAVIYKKKDIAELLIDKGISVNV